MPEDCWADSAAAVFQPFGGNRLKRTTLRIALILLATPTSLIAQTTPSATQMSPPPRPTVGTGPASPAAAASAAPAVQNAKKEKAKKPFTAPAPFSRLAVGGGVSTMGVNLQAAINVNRYLNLRATGNWLNYTVNNVKISGFDADGTLNFAAAGASLDYYPFPNHGFRISPGVLVHNQNAIDASMTVPGGSSFTLNHVTYYSSVTNPVEGTGSLGLNTQRPAFTITTGWGDMISRTGGHWSFPLEVGAAMIGDPTVNIALTKGQVCTNPQGTAGCQDVTSDAALNSDLKAQVAKYKSDLEPLRFYPIVSFGLAYNFPIR